MSGLTITQINNRFFAIIKTSEIGVPIGGWSRTFRIADSYWWNSTIINRSTEFRLELE